MKCPIDNQTLVVSDRQNIEIDYCPECRGVWLDRGELDKIIERSSSNQAPRQEKVQYEKHYESSAKHYDRPYKKKRRESFLGDLFDF